MVGREHRQLLGGPSGEFFTSTSPPASFQIARKDSVINEPDLDQIVETRELMYSVSTGSVMPTTTATSSTDLGDDFFQRAFAQIGYRGRGPAATDIPRWHTQS